MLNKPYVGVTGPVNEQEVRNIIHSFYNNGYNMNTSHIPMLGFLVSYKTLNNQHTNNRRYPKFSELQKLLLSAQEKVFNMIHYNTREQSTLADQVSDIFESENIYDYGLCRALQLNVVWPDMVQVGIIKNRFPEMQTVLQLSRRAMDGLSRKDISNKVSAYGSTIDYVLIDPSGGSGKDFDVGHSAKIYFELQEKNPTLTTGFAGGLSGENVYKKIQELIYIIQKKDFCIDAEGKLRDKITEEYGDDTLNMVKVKKYLGEASKILP